MIVKNVDRAVQQAAMLEPDAYLEWCDAIDGFATDNPDSAHTWGGYRVVQLSVSGFLWPDDPACVLAEGHVAGFQEPGAYIDEYAIFAVNRGARKAWALNLGMRRDPPEDPMLDENTAGAVCAAFNEVWTAVRAERVAEENKTVDAFLDKAREMSPDAYLDWCDDEPQRDALWRVEAYNDHTVTDVDLVRQSSSLEEGVRFTSRGAYKCDLFAVHRPTDTVWVVCYNNGRLLPEGPPPEPLLTGAVADAVHAAALECKARVVDRRSYRRCTFHRRLVAEAPIPPRPPASPRPSPAH
jgi:hypothetical protein